MTENEIISEAQQFNFWIGNWKIKQKILQQDGSWLNLDAKTSVASTLNRQALMEHWEGDVLLFWEGMTQVESRKGLSIRAYDPKIGQWNIYWIDTQNPFFRPTYSGNFTQGKGVFFGQEQMSKSKVMGRITFSDITQNSVHWDFAISNREEEWKTLWIMKMRKDELVNESSIDIDRDGICPGLISHIARKQPNRYV